MSNVVVKVEEASVTHIREFFIFLGYGVDISLEVSGPKNIYLRVVMFGEQADKAMQDLKLGDFVNVTGMLEVNKHKMIDGNTGYALEVYSPELFEKVIPESEYTDVPFQADNGSEEPPDISEDFLLAF